MNLAVIIARIQSQCPVYASVSGGLNLFSEITNAPPGAHAWVALAAEQAEGTQAQGCVIQKIEVQFSVLTLIRADPADATGNIGYAEIQAARDQLFPALLGFKPDSTQTPISFLSGNLSEIDNGFLLWEDSFSTSYTRKQVTA